MPSAKRMTEPLASMARGWIVMPALRALRGLEPISVSRCFMRRPRRESTVTCMQAGRGEEAEQVAAEDPLGQRRLARAQRQVHVVRLASSSAI